MQPLVDRCIGSKAPGSRGITINITSRVVNRSAISSLVVGSPVKVTKGSELFVGHAGEKHFEEFAQEVLHRAPHWLLTTVNLSEMNIIEDLCYTDQSKAHRIYNRHTR